MWLYIVALVFVILGILGSVLGGGIFTIVLVPVGVIIAGSAVLYGMLGRSAQGGGADVEPEVGTSADQPLPHTRQRDSGHAPTSPERLIDARRAAQ